MIGLLTLIVLIANMIGVCIAFFYGYPQPSHESSIGIAVSEGTVFANGEKASEISEIRRIRERKFRFLSKIGLGFMFLGFTLQSIAVFMGMA